MSARCLWRLRLGWAVLALWVAACTGQAAPAATATSQPSRTTLATQIATRITALASATPVPTLATATATLAAPATASRTATPSPDSATPTRTEPATATALSSDTATQIPASALPATPAVVANSQPASLRPSYGPLLCCYAASLAPVTHGMTVPADGRVYYDLSCAGCGEPIGNWCNRPFLIAAGFFAEVVMPGLTVQFGAETLYAQHSDVTWSVPVLPFLCGGRPIQVGVSLSSEPRLRGQTVTITAASQWYVPGADPEAQFKTPPPTPVKVWYSGAESATVFVP